MTPILGEHGNFNRISLGDSLWTSIMVYPLQLHTVEPYGSPQQIRVITKLPNTEQSSKGKGKTHKSTNRQIQLTISSVYLTWFKNNKNRVAPFIQSWYLQAKSPPPPPPPNYIHVPNHINKQVTKVHNN